MSEDTPRGHTHAEWEAMSPEERLEVQADPRLGLVRTADYLILDGEKVTRALVVDRETEVLVVCVSCGAGAAMPIAVIPEIMPRTPEGSVLALCPRCARSGQPT